jgi:hypothetical protein
MVKPWRKAASSKVSSASATKLRPLGCDGNLIAHLTVSPDCSATMPMCKIFSSSAAEMLPAAFFSRLHRALPSLCLAAQRSRAGRLACRRCPFRLLADLDDASSLQRIAGLADIVLHLAPPPGEGKKDTRTRNLLAALGKGKSLPRQLVYVSTTGVYGDCAGAQIDETRSVNRGKFARRAAGRCRAVFAPVGCANGCAGFHFASTGDLCCRPIARRAPEKRLAGIGRGGRCIHQSHSCR